MQRHATCLMIILWAGILTSPLYAQPQLDWSHGVLALVRASAPNVPVYSWNAGTIDCGQTAPTQVFHLKNFGTEAVNITSPPILEADAAFQRTTACPCTGVLGPGQMNSCAITVTFSPDANGVFNDTMRVQTNAWNSYGGFVRYALSGARVSTPAAPHIVIQSVGDNVMLTWNAIHSSRFGCPLQVSQYRLFYADTVGGTYSFLTSTSDTSYVHAMIIPQNDHLFYTVTAQTP
jgi:hypothetical protein